MKIRVGKDAMEGIKALEPGNYPAIFMGCFPKTAGKSVELKFELTGEGTPDGKKRKRSMYPALSPEAQWKLAEIAKALGCDIQEDGAEIEFDFDDVKGNECLVEVVQEDYQGELRDRIQKVLPKA